MKEGSQINGRVYQIGDCALTLDHLLEDISLVFEGGNFSYEFFKKGVDEIPQFITHLNFMSRKQAKLLKYPFVDQLNKQITLYATFLLRELVKDIDKNYPLILEIDYVVGSQILFAVMKYVEDHKIQHLQFADYHLYNSPLSAVTHLILLSKPLRKESEGKIALKLKSFSSQTQFLVGAFAFKWRRYFEQSLSIKGWTSFLEMFYNLNNRMINQRNHDPRPPKGEILKMYHESGSEGLVDYPKFQGVLNDLGKDNVERFISVVEEQKFGHYDILVLLKGIAGAKHKEIMDLCKEDENLGIKAVSLIKDPDTLTKRYLELWGLKSSESFGQLKETERKNLSIEVAFQNLASLAGHNNTFSFFLRIEKDIGNNWERLAEQQYDFRGKYQYCLVLEENSDPIIRLHRYDKVIHEHKLIEHEENYLRLVDGCRSFHRQVKRLANIFERMMKSCHCLDQEEVKWCLESEVTRQVLNKTLLMNADQEMGYYKKERDKIISPLPPWDEYEMKYPVKIVHISELIEQNKLDVFEKVFIEGDQKEYFPQVFRESYEVPPDKRKEVHSNRFNKMKVDREAFILSLSRLGWYISLEDFAYKKLEHHLEARLGFANLDHEVFKDDELIIEQLSFYKVGFGKFRFQEVPKVYFSETVRDIEIAINKSGVHEDNPYFGTQELRRRYLKSYIRINNLKDIELERDVVCIKGKIGNYQINLQNEELYLLDAYKEAHLIEFIDIDKENIENLPKTPFKSLQNKVNTFLKDDQLTKKEQKKILNTLKS